MNTCLFVVDVSNGCINDLTYHVLEHYKQKISCNIKIITVLVINMTPMWSRRA
ncbi:hypothetical protein SAMN05444392_10814 [Seinonella peptonophila]|uniref:Uncharacterized protein n=1 Tax=Seinonella peptonophila TaxID=112248 RepID=A0A1M4Z4N1_9BACL|nr:hypothetical protein [Seinonella peptonophila]SHF12536.1 hypothetical protein SAMN05444392_10814 [Seinonella peptonophila]